MAEILEGCLGFCVTYPLFKVVILVLREMSSWKLNLEGLQIID